MKDEIIKHIFSSLTSKKFITVIYTLTWLFILLLIIILKTCPAQENVINALLIAIGSVFTAFVGGNTFADHYFDGKNKTNKKENNIVLDTKPLEENKK
jgi:hypothetical protein